MIGRTLLVLVLALNCTTPLTHWIFRIENGTYIRGPLYYSLYAITFLGLVCSVVILIRHRKAISN